MDKKILCIDCILNENHKNHEILAIDKASNKERQAFDLSLQSALTKEPEVQHEIFRIRSHLSDLEDQANRNRAELSRIYTELRAKLVDRETTLKRKISDTLERE